MIETFLTNIRASLSDLAEGKLSPWIVTPTTLKNTIKDIQTLLDADDSGYKILTSDPSYYYKFAKFTMLRNNSVIYLSVQFPLTTYMGSFTPYKVMSFPVPNTTFQQIVKITVPSFKIYKHKTQDIVANDKAVDLHLKQVIKRTKQGNKIYSNLAETLLDGLIT